MPKLEALKRDTELFQNFCEIFFESYFQFITFAALNTFEKF